MILRNDIYYLTDGAVHVNTDIINGEKKIDLLSLS